jgi:BioD-like phosphotransacetylase family protein
MDNKTFEMVIHDLKQAKELKDVSLIVGIVADLPNDKARELAIEIARAINSIVVRVVYRGGPEHDSS